MSFLRGSSYRTFDIATLPVLDLTAGPVPVEINHLTNEAHTNAFVNIFVKVIFDNEAAFNCCVLTEVKGKHPIKLPDGMAIPMSFAAMAAIAKETALALYMSENDEVVLSFECGERKQKLLVAFDDPYFSLS